MKMINRILQHENTIFIADRGFESYNNLSVLESKGCKYLIRVKYTDSKIGILKKFELLSNNVFDENVSIRITRKKIKKCFSNPETYRYLSSQKKFDLLEEGSKGFHEVTFRVLCNKYSQENYEYFITNSGSSFTTENIHTIYSARWGIETSFRELKHSIGLLEYNSKKKEFIKQEIFAKMVQYNYCETITLNAVIKQDRNNKYLYQIHFKNAMTICIFFLKGVKRRTKSDIEVLIKKYILPIKNGRHFKRKVSTQPCRSYFYRPA